MCGIVGRFNFSSGAPVDATLVRRMCDAIVHRGPDDWGQFVSGSVGLGMRRLSIIDLAGGHQPMHNEDGTVTVVFNGEIYNHRAVRAELESKGHTFRTSSDTECLVHGYEEYGVECLDRLNGMFAVAIWDEPRRRLLLARDRLGIKPLYLVQTARDLRFASEIKALLVDPAVSREIDPEAFDYYLRYGYVAAPSTLLKQVRKLPPAHYLVAEDGNVLVRRYWDVQYRPVPRSESEHADALADGLQQAVERQLVADVPLGAFLSGGLDSSSIVQCMASVTSAPVNTYSIGFGGADQFHSELEDARFMARTCDTNHHEILVEPDAASLLPKLIHHLDEPLADSSFIVTHLVSTLATQTVKVILSGVGGDELFGGYRRYLGPHFHRYYSAVPGPLTSALRGALGRAPVDRGSTIQNYLRLGRSFVMSHDLPAFDQYDAVVRLTGDAMLSRLTPDGGLAPGALVAERRRRYHAIVDRDPVVSMMHLDLETSLSESLLLLTDKMTMAASLEARVPFLDHEFVELAATVPASLKIKGQRLRYIQKKSAALRLPARVLRKRKRGFGCPVGRWLRSDLQELARDTFAPHRLNRHGLLDAAAVSDIYDAHFQRREDYSDVLLALVTFEIWYDQLHDHSQGELSLEAAGSVHA